MPANVPLNTEVIIDITILNQIGDVSATQLFDTPVNGVFRVSAYSDTQATNAIPVNLLLSWNDGLGMMLRVIEVDRLGLIRTSVIHGVPGQTVTYGTQTFGNPDPYNLHILVEQL